MQVYNYEELLAQMGILSQALYGNKDYIRVRKADKLFQILLDYGLKPSKRGVFNFEISRISREELLQKGYIRPDSEKRIPREITQEVKAFTEQFLCDLFAYKKLTPTGGYTPGKAKADIILAGSNFHRDIIVSALEEGKIAGVLYEEGDMVLYVSSEFKRQWVNYRKGNKNG
jgi:hypothetical protein